MLSSSIHGVYALIFSSPCHGGTLSQTPSLVLMDYTQSYQQKLPFHYIIFFTNDTFQIQNFLQPLLIATIEDIY